MPRRQDLTTAVEHLRSLAQSEVALSATERAELLSSLSEVLQELAISPATEEDYADRRVEELLTAVRTIGRHEFPVKIPVSERWDAFDVLATGINMVAEELEVTLRERTQAVGVLDAAISWIERLFADVPFMVTVLALEPGPYFRVLMMNGTALEAIGRSRTDAVGRTLLEIFDPAEAEISRKNLLAIIERGAVTTYTRRYDIGDRSVTFEVTATPIADGGAASHVVLLARSIDTRAPVERLDDLLSSLDGRVPIDADQVRALLTPRELDVLAVMAAGTLADRSIGAELSIAPATARTHVRNIMVKTGVHDRRDLLGLAVRLDGPHP